MFTKSAFFADLFVSTARDPISFFRPSIRSRWVGNYTPFFRRFRSKRTRVWLFYGYGAKYCSSGQGDHGHCNGGGGDGGGSGGGARESKAEEGEKKILSHRRAIKMSPTSPTAPCMAALKSAIASL
jgi:hypothetical protein